MINIKQVLIIFLIMCVSSCTLNDKNKDYAEKIINKIELFKTKNNRLPENVAEIGVIEQIDDLAFYQKVNDSIYIVWYGLSIGESNVYTSATKTWNSEG